MDLKDISDLITIRQYVVNASNLPSILRAKSNELNDMLMLLDNKIIELILGDQFKQHIDFSNIKNVKEKAIKVMNIYSGNCDVHGLFAQTQSELLNKRGCKKCIPD